MVPSHNSYFKVCRTPSVQIPSQDNTVCDLYPILKETDWSPEFAMVCSSCFYVSQTPSCQWLLLWTMPRALLTVPFWLAIILKKRQGETQTLGRVRFQPVFPLSEVLSGQAKVAVVHCGPQHHLALILPCCPDVGIWLCTVAYGSTYSPGEENKWFVFLLWSHSLRTYKTGFWRLETCACVEPDISWHVSMECVAFHFKQSIFLSSVLH